MSLKFYDVHPAYIEALKKAETKKHGSSKIPNIVYSGGNKFICGVVLEINGLKYYAPISSFIKKQKTNFLIMDMKANPSIALSSIRFSFMFPVPDSLLNLKIIANEDTKRQALLNKEYFYCKKHEMEILDKAKKVYNLVVHKKDPFTVSNCGDFELYEEVCRAYSSILLTQALKSDTIL